MVRFYLPSIFRKDSVSSDYYNARRHSVNPSPTGNGLIVLLYGSEEPDLKNEDIFYIRTT